jgi:hypothetical protein
VKQRRDEQTALQTEKTLNNCPRATPSSTAFAFWGDQPQASLTDIKARSKRLPADAIDIDPDCRSELAFIYG